MLSVLIRKFETGANEVQLCTLFSYTHRIHTPCPEKKDR